MKGLRIAILVMIVALLDVSQGGCRINGKKGSKSECEAVYKRWCKDYPYLRNCYKTKAEWEAVMKRICPDSPHLQDCDKYTTTVAPSECLNGIENVDCQFGENHKAKRGYIGKTSQTVSGLTCQAWNVQTPHKHEFGRLGDHNHCRNPDGESGVWCYTTNPEKRWEYCDVRECNSCDKGFSNATFCSAYPNGHTMRYYGGPSEECAKQTQFRGFTEAGKNLILKTHNELRQKVAAGLETHGNQPGASNMMKMVWNDELAAIAQRWVDQCKGGHDHIRYMCDDTAVGQNFYGKCCSYETKDQVMANVDEAVKAWYKEVERPIGEGRERIPFPISNIQPWKADEGYGHYTQVVWAGSSEVGCGLVHYLDDGKYRTSIVCNYGIGGNFGDGFFAMYKVGKGCSDCPKGTTCDQTYDSLCAGRCENYGCI